VSSEAKKKAKEANAKEVKVTKAPKEAKAPAKETKETKAPKEAAKASAKETKAPAKETKSKKPVEESKELESSLPRLGEKRKKPTQSGTFFSLHTLRLSIFALRIQCCALIFLRIDFFARIEFSRFIRPCSC
jgi:hypothetical protein